MEEVNDVEVETLWFVDAVQDAQTVRGPVLLLSLRSLTSSDCSCVHGIRVHVDLLLNSRVIVRILCLSAQVRSPISRRGCVLWV